MHTVRSALFLLFQFVTVVPWALVCLALAPFPLRVRYRFTMGWPRMVIWAARVLCGIRWQVKGREHLPDGPAVLLSKHQSTWETFFYPTYMPRELCYVFKRELLWIPFFGWGIGLLQMIHIDRRRGRDAFESVVRQGLRSLEQGRWIIMFPEGTRTRAGSQGRYRSGGARLAVRTGVPVIPIAMNSGDFWPRRAFLKQPGTITVSVGPLIQTTGRSPDVVMADVETWIESEMRRITPQAYAHEAASAPGLAPAARNAGNPLA
jgi:1-acyl-sn-glycerol-3-phosphate acyltransferase